MTAAGNDALLWNDGKGHFTEGARAAGITAWGWHSGAAIGDVNGDGRPDLFVAGYTDVERRDPSSDIRVPERPPRRPRPALPQPRQRSERPRSIPRGRREGRHRHPRRARARSGVHGHQQRRPARPLRRERREPEPPLPERPGPTATASASGSRSARRASGSPTRTPGWGSRPPTTAATVAPISS